MTGKVDGKRRVVQLDQFAHEALEAPGTMPRPVHKQECRPLGNGRRLALDRRTNACGRQGIYEGTSRSVHQSHPPSF